jgi:hypothetical protein
MYKVLSINEVYIQVNNEWIKAIVYENYPSIGKKYVRSFEEFTNISLKL